MSLSDTEVYDLGMRLMRGEITTTQYNYHISTNGISDEEVTKVFKRIEYAKTKVVMIKCVAVIVAAMLWLMLI